ncbi:putative manganese transporter [Marinomonas aquiplantarum]|uniref:Putative 10TM heavy-metal exporter n=1 Tax=Marinomonas aquiplantarum TaxID=491951 RepID=A0A366D661_9GAMM|nr:putative manganese transporter [Marinomonas aquiplantarum]RBO84964.1 putative 10TM heavy-metal exporter [Marinomonas aquiplantarum]
MLSNQIKIHRAAQAIHINKRGFIPIAVLILWLTPSLQSMVANVLSDAFLQVSAFVAATLALYYGLSHHLDTSGLKQWMSHKPYREVIFAGVMGVLPGCGGAIVIITQYTQGKIGFGAVVAVLTSTMGDAAFLLISQRPEEAMIVLPISILVGIISGLFTTWFLPSPQLDPPKQSTDAIKQLKAPNQFDIWVSRTNIAFWCLLIVPVTMIALLMAMQHDVNKLLGLPDQLIESLGAIAGFACLLLWALSAKSDRFSELAKENDNSLPKHWIRKVAQDTQFVTSWVVVAFLCFELLLHATGDGLLDALQQWGASSIFVAAAIGLLPGCGPQIMVTGLYLQGAIPLSAQLANAISNDGDALFPAIALAPKAAMLATLYSTIPALITGYAYYWLVEI